MEIRTKAIFYDDEKKTNIDADFSFNIFSVEFANSTPEGYTSIMLSSTQTQITIKIKFDTYWGLIEKYNLSCRKIIE